MEPPCRVPRTIAELCETIIASELLTGAEVDALRTDFARSIRLSSPQAFAQFLIESHQLTPWQVYMLCIGKYRGWIVDHYKIVDQQYWTENKNLCCMAQDQRSGEYVVLLITSVTDRVTYDVLPIWPAAT